MLVTVTMVPIDGCHVVDKTGTEVCVDFSSTPSEAYISYFLSLLFSFVALKRLMSDIRLKTLNQYNSKDLSNFDG